MPRLRIDRGGWLIVLFCLLVGFRPMGEHLAAGALLGVLTAASLLLHECGHALTARWLGVRVQEVGVCLKGPYIRRERALDARQEAVIALGGPMVNAFLAVEVWRVGGGLGCWLALFNLVLLVSNLLPFPGSDGQRILSSLQGMAAARVKTRPLP
jgi:Zn-dependent protease